MPETSKDWPGVEMERRGSVGPMSRGSIAHNLATGPQEAERYLPRDELQAAEQQRDRLLEATQKVRETASRSIPDHVAALEGLYDLAAAIESEVFNDQAT